MFERILLRIFFTCLIVCASLVLCGIWIEALLPKPLTFQVAASLFVIGLASFLTWFVLTLRKIARS